MNHYKKCLWVISLFLFFANTLIAQQSFSLNFDGINDIAHCASSKVFNLTTSGTIEAWINADSFNIESGIIHKGDQKNNSDEEYSLQLAAGSSQYNKVCFIIGHSNGTLGTTWNKIISKTNLVAGKWYHIVATWNSSRIYLYINGNMDSSMANAVYPVSYNGGFNIGSKYYADPTSKPFNGKIDEVRIWNITLTQSQIRDNMYRHFNGNETGLRAYYDFNESSTTTATNRALAIIETITLTSGGSAYTSVPTITISGGGGSGATATVINMKVASVSIANGGTLYRKNNSLSILGGTYSTQAKLNVTSVSGGSRGPITGVSISNAGVYTVLPANAVSVSGGSGTGAKFNLYWAVRTISLTNKGSGYSSLPVVSFNPSGAAATVALSNVNLSLTNGPARNDMAAPQAHAWQGTISTDWSNSSNWFGNWIPYDSTPVVISSLASNHCRIATNVTCNGLSVDLGKTITVDTGATLTSYGNTEINGTFSIESAGSKTGNFIDNGNITYGASSIVNFKKVITPEKWHYNSSPVVNASSNVYWGMAVYSYNEADGQLGTGNAWKAVTNNTTLNALKAYDVYVKNTSKTITFTGQFNTGSFTDTNLTRVIDGFNFVGNPYPSVIDWDATNGWTKTNLENAVYVWNPELNGGQGNYMSYINGVSTNGGSRFIPASQGFLVKVSSGNTKGSISINNTARVANNTAYRASSVNGELIILKSSCGQFSDETAIRFINGATENFDIEYDATKLFVTNFEGSSFYTKSGNEYLSVNALPEITANADVELFSKVYTNSMVTITVNTEHFDESFDILLEDRLIGKTFSIKGQSYTYSASLSDPDNRFVLHLLPIQSVFNHEINESSSGMNDKDDNKLSIYKTSQNTIFIKTGNQLTGASVYIYDVNGRLLINEELLQPSHPFKVDRIKGLITVKVVCGKEVLVKKILL